MTDRKLIVLPVRTGEVADATDEYVSVQFADEQYGDRCRVDAKREQIVGRQPSKNEWVIVLDLEDLRAALKGTAVRNGV